MSLGLLAIGGPYDGHHEVAERDHRRRSLVHRHESRIDGRPFVLKAETRFHSVPAPAASAARMIAKIERPRSGEASPERRAAARAASVNPVRSSRFSFSIEEDLFTLFWARRDRRRLLVRDGHG